LRHAVIPDTLRHKLLARAPDLSKTTAPVVDMADHD
jgi:hypothetical protein